MTTLANRIGRLEAVMAVRPDGEILTPTQQDELWARLATVREAMGEDLIPAIERVQVAIGTSAYADALKTWTQRELLLYEVVIGGTRDCDDHFFTRAFTDEERTRLAVISAGWGDIWAS